MRLTRIMLFSIVLMFAVNGIAEAELYKWTDQDGTLHIEQSPPKNQKYEVLNIDTESKAEPSLATEPAEKPKSIRSADVVIYTTSWCPYCRKAKEYLRAKGISFTEYDIEKDKEAAERKRQLDKRGGVPFAIINGQPISGFSEGAYESALNKP